MNAIAIERDVTTTLFRLAAPIALAMLTEQLLGLVDTAIVGHLGVPALAGITAAGTCLSLAFAALGSFATGLRIMCAQAVGAGSDVFRSARSALVPALCISLIIVALLVPLAGWLLSLVLPSTAETLGASYLRLRAFALPMSTVSMMLAALWASIGTPNLALRILCVVNAVHIPLALILGLGFITHTPFGVAGVGLSSTLVASSAAAPLALHIAGTFPIKSYGAIAEASLYASADTRFLLVVGLISSAIAVALILIGTTIIHAGLWSVPAAWIVAWSVRAVMLAWRAKRATP